LAKMQQERDSATRTIARPNEQLDRITKDRDTARTDTSRFGRLAEDLKKQLDLADEAHGTFMEAERQRRIVALRNMAADANELFAEAREEVRDLHAHIETQERERELQTNEVARLQDALAEEQSKHHALEKQVQDLTVERTVAAASRATANRSQADALARLAAEKLEISTLKATVDLQLEEQKQATFAAETQLQAAKKELGKIQTDLASHSKSALETLRSDLTKQHEKQTEALKKKQAELQEALRSQVAPTEKAQKELKDERRLGEIGLKGKVVVRVGDEQLTKDLEKAHSEKLKLQQQLTEVRVSLDEERRTTGEAQERASRVEGEKAGHGG
jgi:hypothetical protein